MSKDSSSKGQITIFLVAVIIIGGLLFTRALAFPKQLKTANKTIVPPPVDNPNNQGAKSNLQLRSPLFFTNELPTGQPTPTPKTGECDYHGVMSTTCTCPGLEQEALQCINRSLCPTEPFSGLQTADVFLRCGMVNYTRGEVEFTGRVTESGCAKVCIGKPVIYLYPTKKTIVDVALITAGAIVISDPHYPKEGWKNIEAYPDGTLIYQGKTYRELYYESQVDYTVPPTNGIIIPSQELPAQLAVILTRLGLIEVERQEFIEYWIPRLVKLQKPFIVFSLIDSKEKERIDRVEIRPEPDTRIEFLAYFKGINYPYAIEPLVLPQIPPQRVGFTEVEWGGTIK